jgi:hypothetical protein
MRRNPGPNERLTLPEQIRLLAEVIPEDRARARIEKAFRFREIRYQPEYAVEYHDARIDWQSGTVTLRRLPRQPFVPTLTAAEFFRNFMSGHDAAAKPISGAEEPEELTTERTPSGIRTTTDEKVEAACGEWIGKLTERPRNKDAAFETAKSAVARIGVLSRGRLIDNGRVKRLQSGNMPVRTKDRPVTRPPLIIRILVAIKNRITFPIAVNHDPYFQ